jgi:hypothetical protein
MAPLSTGSLSKVVASSTSGNVQLTFTNVLDTTNASEPTNYIVSVNGAVVAVEGVALSNGNRTVALWLPEGALRIGDQIDVTYQLRDSAGLRLNGSSGAVIAK